MSEHYSPVDTGYPPPPSASTLSPVPGSGPKSSSSAGDSATDAAKEQAASVGHDAAQAGQHVAGVAKEQASQVVGEAGQQIKDLVAQAQTQASQQTAAQQEKLVAGLRSLSDELFGLSQGEQKPGVATDLVRQAGERTSALAGWLDGREPSALLNDVSTFARRRPGAFLGIAVSLGLLAGRLTRGLQAGSKQQAPETSDIPAPAPAQPTPSYPNGDLASVSPSLTGVTVANDLAGALVPPLPATPTAGL